jgi:hypothetical protein
MDNLEKFIIENRSAFDRYTPAKRTWENIKSGLKAERPIIWNLLMKAAMIIVVFGTAFVIYKLTTDSLSLANNNNDDTELYQGQPQLKETEIYYNNLINNLYRQARPMLTGNPEIEQEIKIDFSVLDSLCIEIKSDLKDNIANQEVVEALILNYRAKIQILEDMLVILQKKDESVIPESNEL